MSRAASVSWVESDGAEMLLDAVLEGPVAGEFSVEETVRAAISGRASSDGASLREWFD